MGIMKGIILIAGLFALTGCDRIPGAGGHTISVAETEVAGKLSEFRGLEFSKSRHISETGAVCGGVRVRKPDGGMTGFRRFVVQGGDVHLEPITDNVANALGEFEHLADFAVFDTRWTASCEIQ